MKKEILESLKEVEQQHNIKVLYACESGSRAWGFPSVDSDYDVRFIYAHDLKWYLALDKQSDTINTFLPNDLDLSGWDIRKALEHFAKSNVNLYEWLDSPLVYFDSNNFCTTLKNLIVKFFNLRKAVFHYSSLADSTLEKHLNNEHISVKKLMYVLRSYLACEWIYQKQTMPPTLFENIYRKVASADLQNEIENLIKEKLNLTEHSEVKIDGTIKEFIDQSEKYKNIASDLVSNDNVDFSELNNIIFNLIK